MEGKKRTERDGRKYRDSRNEKKREKKRNALAETEWIRVGGRSSGLIYTLL